ncbi:hypothetical protein [Chryseobacterium sp. MA9]|uniref:hypothetical protein n=1 Tax=Chryseobacterium sp. MA9 TaxID=2966625 RepID=UPI002106DAC7|nr:hypothetical protein [Chryseobacterium sp. MA9]UTX46733.1 hypothetical protein KIK00_12240 [Chryseobacterium sp. MA9]
MKKCITVYLVFFSCFLWSQEIIYPKYIYEKDLNSITLEKTEDINFFRYKQIQYIGHPQKNINLKYTDNELHNKILERNYKNSDFIALNKELNERQYKDLRIFVDTSQKTPLTITDIDTTKISNADYNAKMDSLSVGLKLSKEIPFIMTYYDGFPVTIYNMEGKERVIGFGNNVILELEALDKNYQWKKIYNFRKYTCGTGIKFFVLKPKEIATVFEPRLSGNFKTKFRYRLGNILSNEFDGNINDHYLEDAHSF